MCPINVLCAGSSWRNLGSTTARDACIYRYVIVEVAALTCLPCCVAKSRVKKLTRNTPRSSKQKRNDPNVLIPILLLFAVGLGNVFRYFQHDHVRSSRNSVTLRCFNSPWFSGLGLPIYPPRTQRTGSMLIQVCVFLEHSSPNPCKQKKKHTTI